MKEKTWVKSLIWLFLIFSVFVLLLPNIFTKPDTKTAAKIKTSAQNPSENSPATAIFTPTPTPTSIPTPSPRPLTFTEMNERYGPCTKTAVFMYHHIQSKEKAVKNKQTSLTTYSDIFEEQLKYLFSKGYQTIDVSDLVNFFNGNSDIPEKSIMLSFDDGYSDFYTDAYPLLKKYHFKAIVFIPTGLMDNTGYLTWIEIQNLNLEGNVYFGNHTWSHYGLTDNENKTKDEITTADRQLLEKNLNPFKVFAYPYGSISSYAQNTLKTLNYNLAFTTHSGKILCAKNSLNLPRLRMGNLLPNYWGL